MKMSFADHAKEALQLIDGEHRGGWIVDGLRQCLDGNIDENTEGKGRILLDGALRSESDSASDPALIDRARTAMKSKKGLAHADEVSHPGKELDNCLRLLRFANESVEVHGEHDAGLAPMRHDSARRREPLARTWGRHIIPGTVRIDALDHLAPR